MTDPHFDSDVYQSRLRQEIDNYERLFRGRLSQDVPPVWLEVERSFAERMKTATGCDNLYQYVARHVEGRATARILGLGSGACGNELDGIAPLLQAAGVAVELSCMDVNPAVLGQARREAESRGVAFSAITSDINGAVLPPESFDVITAYASLHHFLNLDHVASQVARALKRGGIFVTVDIPTRNGYRLWPETKTIVDSLWAVLPPRFKISHTASTTPQFMDSFPDVDHSLNSFECINSEAIIPRLRAHLHEVDFVPAHAFTRRFFDTQFGPNYDLSRPLDRAVFDFVVTTDAYYLDNGYLRPETFFGAYRRRED